MQRGDVIAGRFEIEERTGAGGMGAVYRAFDRHIGERVALKVILESEPDAMRRFDLEARALAEFSHPRVVRYVTHGHDQQKAGLPYLVMEWLEGEDLATHIARGPLSVAESLDVARHIAEGLAATHARGIIHRDIKPRNLLLPGCRIDRLKIVDFGLVRRAGSTIPSLTTSGMILGTPGYMSPEQASGRAPVDTRSDVFAVGLVLFECLTGKPAFEAGNFMALIAKLLLQDIPRLADIAPHLPAALDDLLARLLAKDPANRPADGAALTRELAAVAVVDVPSTPKTATPSLASTLVLTDLEALPVSIIALFPNIESGALDPSGTTQRSPGDVERAVRQEVAPLGANTYELANGALIVTLRGAGDGALRAAQCALRLRALLPEAVLALATGRADASARVPVGEAVDRATDLVEDERRRNGPELPGIPVDDVTAALLSGRFEIEPSEAGPRLLSEQATGDPFRTLLGRPSPFLGRDRELRMARDLVDAALEDERSQAIVLVGPAGVGKSRLLHELLGRVRQDRPTALLLRGRGDLLGQGSAFSLFRSALLGAAADQPGEAHGRLAGLVRKYVEARDVERVTAFVLKMVGLSDESAKSALVRAAQKSPALMRERLQEAASILLSSMAQKNPVLLALEDVHWGDAASLRLIDSILRELANRPFVAILAARPEGLASLPRITSERSQEVRIGELSRKASEKLARHALGDSAAEEIVQSLAERAAGNPFYLEELVRAVSEGRGDALPETVLGMVEARLATLDPETRRLLRAGSVFGESFWRGGVIALLGEEASHDEKVEEMVSTLVTREIVVPRRESRLAGEQEFAFRHGLLREGAYATLTEADRALGHKLAGAFLWEHGERDPKILAEHFERGGEAARAVDFYRRAAEHALSSGDDEAALRLAARGLSLGAAGPEAAALRAVQTDAYAWSGDFARAYASAEATLALAVPGSESHVRALGSAIAHAAAAGKSSARESLVEALSRVEPSPEAISAFAFSYSVAIMPFFGAADRALAERHLSRFSEVVTPHVDREAMAAAWLSLTRTFWVRFVPRHFERSLELGRHALAYFESTGDRRYGPYAQMQVGLDLVLLGAYEEAEEALQRAIRTSGAGSMVALTSRGYLYRTLFHRGRFTEALPLSLSLRDDAQARGESAVATNAALMLAELHLRLGDLASSRRIVDALAASMQAMPFARTSLAGTWVSLLLAEGRPNEALALSEATLADVARVGMTQPNHEVLLFGHIASLRAVGRQALADEALSRAKQDLLTRASRIQNAAYRDSFLMRIPAHRALL